MHRGIITLALSTEPRMAGGPAALAGFMRDMTREEIDRVATTKGATTMDLALCEAGIGQARRTMNEVIAGYIKVKKN